MNPNTLGTWIDNFQAKGQYSFLRQEAIAATGASAESIKKSLLRLSKHKRIVKVNDYFYVIIPTEYLNSGSPPASWFIHQLMEALRRPYYVGLLSAASLHGASHHQPQEFQVVTNTPVRKIKVARQQVHFFSKHDMEQTPTVDIKTPTGMIRVSSPEATALDLVRFSKAAGQLGNVATVLGDLVEKINPEALLNVGKKQGDIPTLQRLGYLLEFVNADAVAAPLAEWVAEQRPRMVGLRSDLPTRAASRNKAWNLLINDTVEAEA